MNCDCQAKIDSARRAKTEIASQLTRNKVALKDCLKEMQIRGQELTLIRRLLQVHPNEQTNQRMREICEEYWMRNDEKDAMLWLKSLAAGYGFELVKVEVEDEKG